MERCTPHSTPGRKCAAGGRPARRRPGVTTRHRPASLWLSAVTLLCLLFLIVAIGRDVFTGDPADEETATNPTRASLLDPVAGSPGTDPLETTPVDPRPAPRTESVPEPPPQSTGPKAPIII